MGVRSEENSVYHGNTVSEWLEVDFADMHPELMQTFQAYESRRGNEVQNNTMVYETSSVEIHGLDFTSGRVIISVRLQYARLS